MNRKEKPRPRSVSGIRKRDKKNKSMKKYKNFDSSSDGSNENESIKHCRKQYSLFEKKNYWAI